MHWLFTTVCFGTNGTNHKMMNLYVMATIKQFPPIKLLLTFKQRAELPDIQTAHARELSQRQLQVKQGYSTQQKEEEKWDQECT